MIVGTEAEINDVDHVNPSSSHSITHCLSQLHDPHNDATVTTGDLSTKLTIDAQQNLIDFGSQQVQWEHRNTQQQHQRRARHPQESLRPFGF